MDDSNAGERPRPRRKICKSKQSSASRSRNLGHERAIKIPTGENLPPSRLSCQASYNIADWRKNVGPDRSFTRAALWSQLLLGLAHAAQAVARFE